MYNSWSISLIQETRVQLWKRVQFENLNSLKIDNYIDCRLIVVVIPKLKEKKIFS